MTLTLFDFVEQFMMDTLRLKLTQFVKNRSTGKTFVSLKKTSRMEHIGRAENLVPYYMSVALASEKKRMKVFVRGKCVTHDTF